MTVCIREASMSDFEGVARLLKDGHRFHADLLPERFAAEISSADCLQAVTSLSNKGAHIFVAERHSELLGFAAVLVRVASGNPFVHLQKTLFIDTAFVTRAARRQGVGRKIVEAIRAFADTLEAVAIDLSVHTRNGEGYSFWRTMGFEEIALQMRAGTNNRLVADGFSMMNRTELDAVTSVVREVAGASVLDVGCGTGVVAEELVSATDCSVLGIDIGWEYVRDALQRTRTKRERLDFRVCDIHLAPFLERQFDFVVCVDSLHFMNKMSSPLAALRACLKPGGRLLTLYTTPPSQHATSADADPGTTVLAKALERDGFCVSWREEFGKTVDVIDTIQKEARDTADNQACPELRDRMRRYLYVATVV